MRPTPMLLFLPVLILLVTLPACNPPPASTAPFTHEDFPPEAYVSDADAMIHIPAGDFAMGCDPATDPYCDAHEKPLHTVYLDAYEIDKYEVTNARYQACVEAGGCTPPARTDVEGRTLYYGNPNYALFPVVWVDWSQAEAFCAWEGKRLPSEAEWEKAARGSDDTRNYTWGKHQGTYLCEYPTRTQPIRYDPADQIYCISGTSPVGSHPQTASPYGVMDMPGNVQEWVFDWYDEGYYAASPGENPPGPSGGSSRIVRGGDYFEMPVVPHQMMNLLASEHGASLRLTWREAMDPVHAGARLGFRCAASIE